MIWNFAKYNWCKKIIPNPSFIHYSFLVSKSRRILRSRLVQTAENLSAFQLKHSTFQSKNQNSRKPLSFKNIQLSWVSRQDTTLSYGQLCSVYGLQAHREHKCSSLSRDITGYTNYFGYSWCPFDIHYCWHLHSYSDEERRFVYQNVSYLLTRGSK